MARPSNHDHLSTSLTDLMTSLMVIFILLLLVFLNKTAGANAVITDALLRRLQADLKPQGFSPENIQRDKRDRYSILVIVPDNLMNFQPGQHELRPEGKEFLETRIPKLAEVLCGAEYRSDVDSIVVEGHTDETGFRGQTRGEPGSKPEAQSGPVHGSRAAGLGSSFRASGGAGVFSSRSFRRAAGASKTARG